MSQSDYSLILFPSFIASSPSLSPSTTPTDGEESWLDEHLSLIIGVPTGLGLCIIMFLGCLLYCGIISLWQPSQLTLPLCVGVSAAYHSWRENRPHGDSYYQGGGAGTTGYTGTTGTTPHTSSAGYNSSMYNASSFEPSADTLPRGTKMPRHPMSDTSVNEDSVAIDPSEATSTF